MTRREKMELALEILVLVRDILRELREQDEEGE